MPIEDDPVLAEASKEAPPPRPAEIETDTKPSALRTVVEWLVIAGGALLVALIIKTFLLQAFYIPSESMTPTLKVNDRVLVNKLSYDLHPIHRGDIVVFKNPPNQGTVTKDLIKRVIGLPGETVEFRDDHVLINGKVLDEPYLKGGVLTEADGPVAKATLGKNQYFVMGDNRPNSHDSRFFGPIPKSLIIGRAFVRVWPVTDLNLM